MIRQSSVIQEINAFIENLTFVIERIDFRKPFFICSSDLKQASLKDFKAVPSIL